MPVLEEGQVFRIKRRKGTFIVTRVQLFENGTVHRIFYRKLRSSDPEKSMILYDWVTRVHA